MSLTLEDVTIPLGAFNASDLRKASNVIASIYVDNTLGIQDCTLNLQLFSQKSLSQSTRWIPNRTSSSASIIIFCIILQYQDVFFGCLLHCFPRNPWDKTACGSCLVLILWQYSRACPLHLLFKKSLIQQKTPPERIIVSRSYHGQAIATTWDRNWIKCTESWSPVCRKREQNGKGCLRQEPMQTFLWEILFRLPLPLGWN